MNSTAPRSKREKERASQAEQEKQNGNKMIVYAGIAICVMIAVAAVAWFMMQPGAVTLDSMKKSLNNRHYEDVKDLTLSAALVDAGAVGGISFVVDDDHHEDLCHIYQFNSAEAAAAYAAGKTTAIVNGVWVLEVVGGHTHAPSDFIKTLFDNLVNGKKVAHNPGHDHSGHDH